MRREIEIKQHDRQDCGAASLASLCAYYGLKLPLFKIRQACGTTQEGTSLQGIIDGACEIGMCATGLESTEKSIDDLRSIPRPVILHLKKENGWLHFVVLYKVGKEKSEIMDPETGKLTKVSNEELLLEWSGYLVDLYPDESFLKGDFTGSFKERFRRVILQHRKRLVPALTGSIAYIFATLSTSLFLKYLIDEVIPGKNVFLLTLISCCMALLAICSSFVSYYRSLILLRCSVEMDYSLIVNYFRALSRHPSSFFSTRSSGELNSRIGDVYRIRNFITSRVLLIVVSVATLLISTVILFSYNDKLAIVAMSFTPIYLLIHLYSENNTERFSKQILKENSAFEALSIESISLIPHLVGCDSFRHTMRKLKKAYASRSLSLFECGRFIARINSVTELLSKTIVITTLVYGSFLTSKGEITVGELVTFISLIGIFTNPVCTLIESNKEISEAKCAAKRLFEIIESASEDDDESIKYPVTLMKGGDIVISGLSFTFKGGKEVFKGIWDRIPYGKITLIKGGNGSGKSTLARLITRDLTPTAGTISVNGEAIGRFALRDFRKSVSLVPQRTAIINGTIMENITLGENCPDFNWLLSCCVSAGLGKFLEESPQGVFTKVGENGKLLSGGEIQKIALARAFYRRPAILILDEATSQMDAASRKDIGRRLADLSGNGVTVIVISHDNDFNTLADHIVDLDENDCAIAGQDCMPD